MPKVVLSAGVYRVSALASAAPGNWLGVECSGCGCFLALFSSNTPDPAPFEGPGRLGVKCPKCGTDDTYGVTAIERRPVT